MKKTNSADAAVGLQLDLQLCFALYSTMLSLNKTYRRVLADLGVTYPQYLVMLVLWEGDGLTVAAIAERLFLESPTLTPLLKRLQTRGLIDRRRAETDERQLVITLTPEGKRLKTQAREVPACVATAMECSQRDLETLRGKLTALRDALVRSG